MNARKQVWIEIFAGRIPNYDPIGCKTWWMKVCPERNSWGRFRVFGELRPKPVRPVKENQLEFDFLSDIALSIQIFPRRNGFACDVFIIVGEWLESSFISHPVNPVNPVQNPFYSRSKHTR
jgi:hypothetical protein